MAALIATAASAAAVVLGTAGIALVMAGLVKEGIQTAIAEGEKKRDAEEADRAATRLQGLVQGGMTGEGARKFVTDLPTQPIGGPGAYSHGLAGQKGIDWAKVDFGDWNAVIDPQKSAANDMEDAAGRQITGAGLSMWAATTFGRWVGALPNMVPTGPVAGAATGTISGGRGGVTQNALGGSGTVYKPTMFLAGEAGPEDYSFTPRRNGGAQATGGGGGTVVHANINITEAGNAQQTAAYVVRELEKAVLNG
jgi:hypothetical protein